MAIIDDHITDTGYSARGFRYVRAPEPLHFPIEDEEPVGETARHLKARSSLYWLLEKVIGDKATIGSDQFVYWDRTDPQRCVAPDLFVKLGVPHTEIEIWKTWEGGTPDLAVEVMSPSDRTAKEWEDKLRRYRASGIRELVRFDEHSDKLPLRVWDDVDSDLVERSPTDPRHRFCRALNLWWIITRDEGGQRLWLSHDPDGKAPLLTAEEQEKAARLKAEAAAQAANTRAEQEAAKAATATAEAERARHEIEQLRAEMARLRGESR